VAIHADTSVDGDATEVLTMDAQTAELTTKAFLREIRQRLENAATVAKAAEACAEAGSIAQALSVALDLEEDVYDVRTLLNGASLIMRMSKT
jgi:hypothetical protein